MIKLIMMAVSTILVIIGMIVAHLLLKSAKDKSILDRVLIYIYTPLAIWSAVYFVVCVVYAGYGLSWIWLWPLIAGFSAVRVVMVKARLEEKARLVIPRPARIVYRIFFVLALSFFLFVESRIIGAMTADPPGDLDYVIVLGAGLIGREPKNPFRVRIERAAEYMAGNPRTLLVASGGQGDDEEISEAECIRTRLVNMYGIDDSRIIMEDRSRDTEQNLRYSLELIGDPDASVGIITNSFHEYRAMLIADHTGYRNVHTVPATTLLPVGIHYMVREFFGVVEQMIKYQRF